MISQPPLKLRTYKVKKGSDWETPFGEKIVNIVDDPKDSGYLIVKTRERLIGEIIGGKHG